MFLQRTVVVGRTYGWSTRFMNEQSIYNLSEAARELGLSVDWLRRAESRVSLPPARRDKNDHRYYTEGDLERLRDRRLRRPGG